jgi:FdhD protein
MKSTNQPIKYSQFRSGSWETVEAGVIVETPVSLTVNGETWLTFMCTPNHLDALGVGFLFNEGLIERASDIADLRLCPTWDNVDVWLYRTVDKPREWKRTSGCTGGYTAATLIEIPRPALNGLSISPRTITELIDTLFDSQDLYRKVGGVHTSILSDGRDFVLMAEDIGRHNSLDKLAGRYLLEGIELENKILLTTGRISSEMLQKAARLGAAVVVSRTSPSSMSIDMADQMGITLIGYARRDRFNAYTHPERLFDIEKDLTISGPVFRSEG